MRDNSTYYNFILPIYISTGILALLGNSKKRSFKFKSKGFYRPINKREIYHWILRCEKASLEIAPEILPQMPNADQLINHPPTVWRQLTHEKEEALFAVFCMCVWVSASTCVLRLVLHSRLLGRWKCSTWSQVWPQRVPDERKGDEKCDHDKLFVSVYKYKSWLSAVLSLVLFSFIGSKHFFCECCTSRTARFLFVLGKRLGQ